METIFIFRKKIGELSKQLCIEDPNLQDNISLIRNSIDTLDKIIHGVLFKLKYKSKTGKKSDKQQPTESIKETILKTLHNAISVLRTDLVHKLKTIDILLLIIG